jgi:CHAT domain-containing protein
MRIVLAEYYVREQMTLLFVLCPEFEVPQIAVISKGTVDWRAAVASLLRSPERSIRELSVSELQDAFGELVEPLSDYCAEGDLLWIVPHDALHYVPFHGLSIGGKSLVERNPVCYAPSASVMKHCCSRRAPRGKNALVFGDSRSDLPYANEEARAVAQLFSTVPTCGSDVTSVEVRQKITQDKAAVIHFACHGYFDAKEPLQSGILLATGPDSLNDVGSDSGCLTAEEIFGLRIDADLVTLSACDTGLNENLPGEELVGLTRAILYAGTPSVIVTLWPVDDLASTLLMERFYELLLSSDGAGSDGRRPTHKAIALQSAQRYIKEMSAQRVIEQCDLRLATATDEVRHLRLLLDQADAKAFAGDLAPAIDAYRSAAASVGDLAAPYHAALAARVDSRLNLLEFAAEAPRAINYNAAPFSSPYHWAPFILVGDWESGIGKQ